MVSASAPRHNGTDEVSVLGQVLLGLLARAPATGYGLAQQVRHPVAFFWEARHSQIYPELRRLAEADLVSHRTVPGRGPRPSKEYRLTDAGRRAHERWVLGPVEQSVRDVETVHVWSLWLASDPATASDWISTRRAQRRDRLTVLEGEREKIIADGGLSPGEPNWSNLAAVEAGILSARAGLAWCDWMLETHLGG